MLGTVYKIKAVFSSDTRGAEAGAERMAKKTGRVADEAERAQAQVGGLGGVLRTAFGAAAVGGISLAARYIGNLASKAENAEISIAAVLSVNKVTTFNKGLVRARELMDRFNKASKASPGDADDFLNVFNRTAPILAKFNPNDERITDFAGRGLAAAFAFNQGDVDLTGDQLSQILSGQGGADNKTFNALKGALFEQLQITETGSKATEVFNKLAQSSPEAVFIALNRALGSLDQANEAFGKTFTGMMGSLKQSINSTLKEGVAPFFAEFKKSFADALTWIDENDDKIKEFARTLGGTLANALRKVVAMLTQGFREVASLLKFASENLSAFVLLGSGVAMKRTLAAISASAMIGGPGVGIGTLARGHMAASSAVAGRVAGGVRRGGLGGLNFLADALLGTQMMGHTRTTSRGARLGDALRRGSSFATASIAQGGGTLAGGLMHAGRTGAARAGGAIRNTGARAIAGARAGGAALRTRGIAALANAGGSIGGVFMGGARRAGGAGARALGAGARLAAPGLGKLAGAISSLGVAIVPAIVIIGMIAGAFKVLKDNTNDATIFLKSSIKELKQALDTLAAQFGFGGDKGGFGGAVKSFVEWLGTGVVGVLGIAVKAVERFVTGLTYLVAFIQGVANALIRLFSDGDILKQGPGGIADVFSSELSRAFEERDKAYINTFGDGSVKGAGGKKGPGEQSPMDEKAALTRAAAAKRREDQVLLAARLKPKVEVKVVNNNDIKTDADPDKVAIALEKITGTSINRAVGAVGSMGML